MPVAPCRFWNRASLSSSISRLPPPSADANLMLDAARRGGTFVWSASSLRFALEVQDVQRRREELGAVLGADAYSPANLHPANPGLTHYGVHGVEILYGLMGTGCRTRLLYRRARR